MTTTAIRGTRPALVGRSAAERFRLAQSVAAQSGAADVGSRTRC
jgi:hypothetical protein